MSLKWLKGWNSISADRQVDSPSFRIQILSLVDMDSTKTIKQSRQLRRCNHSVLNQIGNMLCWNMSLGHDTKNISKRWVLFHPAIRCSHKYLDQILQLLLWSLQMLNNFQLIPWPKSQSNTMNPHIEIHIYIYSYIVYRLEWLRYIVYWLALELEFYFVCTLFRMML